MQNTHRKQKKRYGWLIFFAAVNWLAIALVIWKVDPETIKDFILPGSYLPMTILVMLGIFWLLSILFLSAIRALRWTIGITLFLQLRVMGLGSILNGLLILGLLISWEIYTHKSKRGTETIDIDSESRTKFLAISSFSSAEKHPE